MATTKRAAKVRKLRSDAMKFARMAKRRGDQAAMQTWIANARRCQHRLLNGLY